MRIMGLDFGSKTTGVAVSDPLGITAQGIETITRKDENKLRQTCARIEELIREYEVGTIVLGQGVTAFPSATRQSRAGFDVPHL